jgi:hypothetical protein
MKTTTAARNVRYAPHKGVCVTGIKFPQMNLTTGVNAFYSASLQPEHHFSVSICGGFPEENNICHPFGNYIPWMLIKPEKNKNLIFNFQTNTFS